MSSHAAHSAVPPERPHIRRPQTARSRFIPIQLLFPLLLLLSLSSSLLSNVPLASAHAVVTPLPTQKATQTFGQFLAQKAPARKPFVYPSQIPNRFAKEQAQNPAKVLPSTEPVKMQALHQTLSPAFLVNTGATTTAATGTPTATGSPIVTATSTATTAPAATATPATPSAITAPA